MKYLKGVINEIDGIKRKSINQLLKISVKIEQTTFRLISWEKKKTLIILLRTEKKKPSLQTQQAWKKQLNDYYKTNMLQNLEQ